MQKDIKYKLEPLPLDQVLPDGQIVNRKWLYSHWAERSLVDYYLRSGKLVPVARGVYRRPGPDLKWEQVVYSLQKMKYDVRVGADTALELQGYGHYVSFNGQKSITLVGTLKAPAWINEVDKDITYNSYVEKCFTSLPENSTTYKEVGHWDWNIEISTVELALFELLSQLKSEADFLEADKYFESATTLRPNLVNELLQTCTEIKTKRLFMWFADRHNHHWFKSINSDSINLGKGKRMIVKGGSLDTKYLITVPKEMTDDEQFFF